VGSSMNSELMYLHELVKATPLTASGRVAAAWTIIRANLAAGKKLREVFAAAERDGLSVPYAHFRVYVHRLRKRDLRLGTAPPSTELRSQMAPQSTEPPLSAPVKQARPPANPLDPLYNLRAQRAKNNVFEYRPLPRKGLTQ